MMRPGRPQSATLAALPPRAEEFNCDITYFIDMVMSRLYIQDAMPTVGDIQASMKHRLIHECGRLQEISKERESLAAAYNRFLDLTEEQIRRQRRVERLVAVFGKDDYLKIALGQPGPAGEGTGPIIEALPPDFDTLRDSLPLWEAMKEYLHHVPEARIAEVEEFLGYPHGMGIEGVNRQAIESALKRHPETFKTRKKGREKFISLKEKARE
jgi:hypothetical protein